MQVQSKTLLWNCIPYTPKPHNHKNLPLQNKFINDLTVINNDLKIYFVMFASLTSVSKGIITKTPLFPFKLLKKYR